MSSLLNPNQESTRTQTDITPHKKWKEQRGQTSKLPRALKKIRECLLEAATLQEGQCGRPRPSTMLIAVGLPRPCSAQHPPPLHSIHALFLR